MKAYETMRNRFIWRMKNHERTSGLEVIVLEPSEGVNEQKFNLPEWYGFWKNYGIDYMEVK